MLRHPKSAGPLTTGLTLVHRPELSDVLALRQRGRDRRKREVYDAVSADNVLLGSQTIALTRYG